MRTQLLSGEFRKPHIGVCEFNALDPKLDWSLEDDRAWQSNGGPGRAHPDRSLPFSLDVLVPDSEESLQRIHIYGVFALHAGSETPGTHGALVAVKPLDGPDFRLTLINGKHYAEGEESEMACFSPGDGSMCEPVGFADFQGRRVTIRRLSIDIPSNFHGRFLRFTDLGSSASFVLLDVRFEFAPDRTCPFGSKTKGVSLAELGSAVRIGDRVKFNRAIKQLETSLSEVGPNLDEARGSVLLFLAVISAAKLESGTSEPLHRFQLDAARRLEIERSVNGVISAARELIEELTPDMSEERAHTDSMINRALAVVERGFAREIVDEEIANYLGLSTSHFRFLFRQATGQPFHKYLISVRLEKARTMLIENNFSVSEVSKMVGFNSPAHFTRAFVKRFNVSPSAVRVANR